MVQDAPINTEALMTTERLCLTCHAIGTPKTQTRGSIWIEIVLWLCFLVPGLVYSIWRLTTRQKVCRTCGSPTLVPVDSPAAKAIRSAA